MAIVATDDFALTAPDFDSESEEYLRSIVEKINETPLAAPAKRSSRKSRGSAPTHMFSIKVNAHDWGTFDRLTVEKNYVKADLIREFIAYCNAHLPKMPARAVEKNESFEDALA